MVLAHATSLQDPENGPMKYVLDPIKAALEGGDFDGKTIELPHAFRGVDVQKEGEYSQAARYRFARRRSDGTLTYEYVEPRGPLRRGATVVKVAEGVRGAGLRFYPKTKLPKDAPPF